MREDLGVTHKFSVIHPANRTKNNMTRQLEMMTIHPNIREGGGGAKQEGPNNFGFFM